MELPRLSGSLSRIGLGLIAIAVFAMFIVHFYPDTHSFGGLLLKDDASHIRQRSLTLLSILKLDTVSYSPKATLRTNSDLLERTYLLYGGAEANQLLRNHVPGYFWNVRIFKPEPEAGEAIHISAGGEERMIQRILSGDLNFQFSGNGKLISLEIPVEDSITSNSLSVENAYALVRTTLLLHADPALLSPLIHQTLITDSMAAEFGAGGIEYAVNVRSDRTDHLFSWVVYDEALQDTIDVRAALKGDLLAHFSGTYRFTRGYVSTQRVGIADVFEIIFYGLFTLIVLIVGFRRLRAFEIGFRSALYLGIFITVLFTVWLYFELSLQMDSTLELLIPLLIAPLAVGASFIPLWAIGESIGRETWKDKFITFDLLRTGHILHSRVGRALLSGTVAGFALLSIGLLVAYLAGSIDTVWIRESNNDGIRQFSTPSPALFVIGNALLNNLFGLAFLFMVIVSLARQRVGSKTLLILLTALMFTVIDTMNLVPLPAAWLVILPVMILLVWLFVETDLLTTFLALLVFSILDTGLTFFLPGNTAYLGDGMMLTALFAILLIWAIAAMLLPDSVDDLEEIAPRFQRHITERQRLSRELEIARDVQMSFLPKHNPRIPGLDIASQCAPALEVGGDYYDFIDLGNGRLGIAIGDVSGKGTQAAFYMTLTKGFLQALASQHQSPANVLIEMNRLFYRNVDRGHFISMIYAVIDMNTKELRVARAGHSPIMRRAADSTVDSIHSRGIALGFEAGETFSAAIEDVTVPIRPGDVFVFYTDGYPEAMTRLREEYGEDRMAASLQQSRGSSAEELLAHLHGDTRRFAGRAKQHDDMTMVVVRIPG